MVAEAETFNCVEKDRIVKYQLFVSPTGRWVVFVPLNVQLWLVEPAYSVERRNVIIDDDDDDEKIILNDER